MYSTCRKPSSELENAGTKKVISGIDMRDPESPKKLVEACGDISFDTVLVVPGYFTLEKFGESNRDEELKMFDICAIGPLR